MQLKQYSQTKLALGSDTTLVIVTDKPQQFVDQAFNELWLHIFLFERQFSRFLPASELSQFNQRAGLPVPISRGFYELLSTAQKLAKMTNGLYNPFILPALQRSGYRGSVVSGYAADSNNDYSNRTVVDISELQLQPAQATIPYGTALDMGGCGKGFLADQLAAHPIVEQLEGYWFSLGGDIVGGGTDEFGEPWDVAVQDARHPGEVLPVKLVLGRDTFAIASSGTIVRKGRHHGRSWHHIIDPRTQQPAVTDIQLATVVHTSAVYADVLASCAVIVGSKQAHSFLQKNSVTDAVLQTTSKTQPLRGFGAGALVVQPKHSEANL